MIYVLQKAAASADLDRPEVWAEVMRSPEAWAVVCERWTAELLDRGSVFRIVTRGQVVPFPPRGGTHHRAAVGG